MEKISSNSKELQLLLAINKNIHLNPFLEKPYGLNLLYLLEKLESEMQDNGIEDTFDNIVIAKPKKLAFVQYCAYLAKLQVINLKRSPVKKSKKTMRLSKTSKKALNTVRKKLNGKIS